VFISVYTHLKELRQDTKFENWICRIAMNVYRNEKERRAARKRAATVVSLTGDFDDPEDLRLPPSPTANPEVEILEKEKLDQVRQALQELPPQMRSCLLLRVDDELSYREIAAVMGISINTVSAHLHQARKLMEEKLGRYFVELGSLSVEEER
jgi:RNA polymerase sigma-70 factor (ECF subfamily)